MTAEVQNSPAVQPEQKEAPAETTSMEQIRIRPVADVYRSKQAVRLFLDLPGARDQDTEVEVHDGVLSVTARVQRGEHEMRIYERSFRLDRHLDTEQIEAKLERGVLHLHLPFHEEAQPRRIEVKTA